jgi:RNA-directed DNA polymerase
MEIIFLDENVKGVVSLRKLSAILGVNINELKKIAKDKEKYYRPFEVPKPNSVEKRLIDNPTGKLKYVQNKIKERILDKLSLPNEYFGYVKGKSNIDNAFTHINQDVAINIDLRKCFPSTSYFKVYKMFRNRLDYGVDVSKLLTELCTRGNNENGYVPQGAPTSGQLINLCLFPIVKQISALSNSKSLRSTIFADDLTLSGRIINKKVITSACKIINHNNYKINKKKLKFFSPNVAKEVTGIKISSDSLSLVDKKYQEIHTLLQKYKENTLTKKEENSLKGKIKYLKRVLSYNKIIH